MTRADDRTIPQAWPDGGHSRDESVDGVDLVLEDAQAADVGATVRTGSATAAGEQNIDHVALPVGYRLAEYTIERVLGSGGFGLTYLARDNHLECEVAIKEYLPNDMAVRVEGQTVCARSREQGQDYQSGLKRFLAEARTLASFRHPNIVRITRFFEANGTAYMVMDYERGQPLREWRRRRPMVTEEELLRMFLPLLEGLEVVHQGKVTHRDIKPANIYVRDSDGSLVLLDFGSARQTAGASHGLTTIVTPGYAPFEQYHSRGVQGPWSDIYAMGGVLYWMITGEKPLEAPARLKEDTLVPVREAARERFSPAFLAAIDWALQSDEKKRPHSVAEFRAALTGQMEVPVAVQDSTAAAASVADGKPKADMKSSRSLMWVGFAAVGVAVVGLAGRHFLAKPVAEPAPQTAVAAVTPAPAPVPQTPAPALPEPATAKPEEKPAGAKVDEKPLVAKHASAKPAAAPSKPPAAERKQPPAKDPAPAVPAPKTAKVTFKVAPYGDVYLDGKKIGRTPPLTEMPVPIGPHKLEIRGDAIPYIAHYPLDLKAGETKQIWTKFGSD